MPPARSPAAGLAGPPQAMPALSAALTLLFACAVAVIVTNVFAPQTLVGLIAADLGLGEAAAGLVAMATLIGYAGGLFLLVPLADLVENRRLVLRMLAACVVFAGLAGLAPGASLLILALVLVGAACSMIQVLVPLAAAMAPPERRGQVVGDVMSGLMLGILLARPLASLVADTLGWRAFHGLTGLAMALLWPVLALRLPPRQPADSARYGELIASLGKLLAREPVLRWRALTAALSMAAFSLFWTAVAFRLAAAPFHLGQRGIAVFALVGAAGAAAAPMVGRLGDRGLTRATTIVSHLLIIAGFGLAACAGRAGAAGPMPMLVAMGLAAVLLDIGVTGDQTLGRRAVNMLDEAARGRLNGLFVGLFFLGGALGAGLAGLAWSLGGWLLITLLGAAFGFAALVADAVAPRA